MGDLAYENVIRHVEDHLSIKAIIYRVTSWLKDINCSLKPSITLNFAGTKIFECIHISKVDVRIKKTSLC